MEMPGKVYHFRFCLTWEELDISSVTIQNSVCEIGEFPYSRVRQGEKSRIGFIVRLFCKNWEFVNTCERSVSYTCLRKKYLVSLSVYLYSIHKQ